jgi:hypothetical protein
MIYQLLFSLFGRSLRAGLLRAPLRYGFFLPGRRGREEKELPLHIPSAVALTIDTFIIIFVYQVHYLHA